MANDIAIVEHSIATMNETEITKVVELEKEFLQHEQIKIATSHILHAGMYARTIIVPAGVALTGALMKVETLLTIQGHFLLFAGGKTKELNGYSIFKGSTNRKQAGMALSDTYVTMTFPTQAKTVAEAEAEFTDDAEKLWSRYEDAVNYIHIGD